MIPLALSTFPILSLTCYAQGYTAVGHVYAGVTGLWVLVLFGPAVLRPLASALMAWAKRRRWQKREFRALVAQLTASRADMESERALSASLAEGEAMQPMAEAA